MAILDQFGAPIFAASELHTRIKQRMRRRILARYDAAQTTPDNERHWANADSLSADAGADASVRQRLRDRSRYEFSTNSYAKGIVLTIANDTIGTGPRLRMIGEDREANRAVERAFVRWSREIDLGAKLRTMRISKVMDGESFALLTTNPGLNAEVQLDMRLIEADQIASPTLDPLSETSIDGIRLDRLGNVTGYEKLLHHPGDIRFGFNFDSVIIRPEHMIHYFRRDRPEQHRGIPELTSALPLFAQLRRYTLAVLAAAETAADFAAVMYTDGAAMEEIDQVDPLDAIELEKRAMLTLPQGWKMSQIRAEQPSTTYADFKHEVLNEIARSLNMPFNVAAGNSSGYNFASGRLDHQTYFRSIDVERAHLQCAVLDRILAAWFDEAALSGVLAGVRIEPGLPHRWYWDGHGHVDPMKEARAAQTLWDTGLLSDDEYLFSRGIDPDEHYETLAMQSDRRKAIGLPLPGEADRQPAVEVTTNA